MRIIRQIVLALAVVSVMICITLLLNITAPNPTGRRYSSETPLTNKSANAKAIGDSGEAILARDLSLPNNNAGQAQCVCTPKYDVNSKQCNVCLAQIQSFSDSVTYRRPDFVGANFIAESKNVEGLAYSGREAAQISDYVLASLLIKRPLWVYVRVNTPVAPEFATLVQSTGGDVIYYFTVPGYVDSVDDTARRGLAVSGTAILGIGGLEWWLRRRKVRMIVIDLSPKKPSPDKPIDSTVRKLDVAEDFASRSKDRLRGQLDKDDVWGDEA